MVAGFRVVSIVIGMIGRNDVRTTTMMMMMVLENIIIKRSFTHALLTLGAAIVRDCGRVRGIARLAVQSIVRLYIKIAITIT